MKMHSSICTRKDMPSLMKGIQNALDVISLWEDNHLIGLIRTVGDKETLIFIQDIIILETHKRKGYGGKLLERVLNTYKHGRIKVLLTDQRRKPNYFMKAWDF
ncbi:MAG: GNAT family N-acetyltransferase [Clostridia bacterium]|nr:GNAT family N-acetyltransferase [Clostridia bacterium]